MRFFWLIIFFSFHLHAQDICSTQLKIETDLAKRVDPIYLDGFQQPLSFSYDFEVGWKHLYRIMKDTPEFSALMHETALKENSFLTRADLREILGMSDKQLDVFVFKNIKRSYQLKHRWWIFSKRKEITTTEDLDFYRAKGIPGVAAIEMADLTGEFYLLTDFSPREIALIRESKYGNILSPFYDKVAKRVFADKIYKKVILDYLTNQKKLELKLHEDSGFVEFTHPSYLLSPKEFIANTRTISKEFDDSSVHLHLGVPSAIVNRESMHEIAAAVENRVIMSLAQYNFDSILSYYSIASLVPSRLMVDSTPRTVVKLEINGFPNNVHNLEIRQYVDQKNGEDLMSFAVNLTQQSSKLKMIVDSDIFAQVSHRSVEVNDKSDKLTGDLRGALSYTISLLELSNNAKYLEIAKKIRDYLVKLQSIENYADFNNPEVMKLRTELGAYLGRIEIDEILADPTLYYFL